MRKMNPTCAIPIFDVWNTVNWTVLLIPFSLFRLTGIGHGMNWLLMIFQQHSDMFMIKPDKSCTILGTRR